MELKDLKNAIPFETELKNKHNGIVVKFIALDKKRDKAVVLSRENNKDFYISAPIERFEIYRKNREVVAHELFDSEVVFSVEGGPVCTTRDNKGFQRVRIHPTSDLVME